MQAVKLSNNDSVSINVSEVRIAYEQTDGSAKLAYGYPNSTILLKTTFDDLIANSCGNLVIVPAVQPQGTVDVGFNPQHVYRIYRSGGKTKIQIRETNQIFDTPLSFAETSMLLGNCGASADLNIDSVSVSNDTICFFYNDASFDCFELTDTTTTANWYTTNGSTTDSLRWATVIKAAVWYGADTTGFLRHQVGLLDGSRITVFQDSVTMMKFGTAATNYVTVGRDTINIVTSGNPGMVRIKTDTVNFFDKYLLANATPISTNGVMSFHYWRGNGTNTTPGFTTMSQLSDSVGSYILEPDSTIYTVDGTVENRTIEVNGPIDWLDADGDGEFNVSMGDVTSQGNLFVTGVETKINHVDAVGISTVVADGNGVEISTTDVSNDNIVISASGIVDLNGDSIVMDDIGLAVELPTILGLTAANVIKKIDGVNDGDVITWDSVASVWTSSPSSYLNIYNSNGTIGTNRTASITDNLNFVNNSAASGERFNVTFDNGVSSTNFLRVQEGTGILLQSSENIISLEGATALSDVLSPTSLASNTDDYTGLNGSNFGRLSASPGVNLTGIANGRPGRILPFFNVGNSNITLKDNATSTAGNRFQMATDVNLKTDDGALFIYDSVSLRHRLLSTNIGSLYTGSGQLLNGRSGSLYARYMLDTLNDFALGYFTNGTSDDKTTYGKFGLHMDGDGGFSTAAKETYIKGAGFNLLGTSYIAARQNYFDLYGVDRLTVGGTQNYSQLVGNPTSSYFLMDHGNTEVYNTISLGMKKDHTGIPSNQNDYGFLYQGGGMTGSDTSAISVWWGIPQISDTVSSITSGNVRAVSSNRGFGVQSLFDYNAGGVAATLKYDWLKIKTGSIPSDTTLDGITFYNGSYEIPNDIPSSAAGDTSIMVWASPNNSFFIDKSAFCCGATGSGENIYNTDDLLKAGGTTVGLDSGSLKLEMPNVVGGTKYGLEIIASDSTTSNRFISMRTQRDSLRFQETANEYYMIGTKSLQFNISDQERHVADSVQWIEGTVQTVDSTRYILGMTTTGWMKRWDADTTGTVLTSVGGLWKQRALSSLLSGTGLGGIYGGSGTVPTGVIATLTDNLTFSNNTATTGERFIVTYDDGVSSTNFFQVKEGGGITMQSSEDGIWLEGSTMLSDVVSPSTLVSNTNNYTGLDGSNFGRLSASPAINLTGIANGRPGRLLPIFNVGSSHIELKDNATSTALNRFEMQTDLNLKSNDGALFIYDSVTQRNRLLATSIGSPYTGSGQLLNGRSGSLYMSYMLDTLNDFALGYFTNGTSDDKSTYGKFGLHMDGDLGFSVAGKETYIKGASFDLRSLGNISARGNGYTLEGQVRPSSSGSTIGTSYLYGATNYTVASSTYSQSNQFGLTNSLDYLTTLEIGSKKYLGGTPSNKADYNYIFQNGGKTGADTSAVSMWLGLPQLTDTVGGISSSSVRGVSSIRGWGVQSLFDVGAANFATSAFDWIKVSTGYATSDTAIHTSSNDGIVFYNKYEIPNEAPSSAAGDTSIMVWTGKTNSFFIDKTEFCCGGSSAAETNVPPTIRPSQFTAKQNNLNPTGYSTTKAQTIVVSSDDFWFITGLEAATRDGVLKTFYNDGTKCIGIAKQHTDSDADNRFIHEIIILPEMSVTFRYDSLDSRWSLVSSTKGDVTYSMQYDISTKSDMFVNDMANYDAVANSGVISRSSAGSFGAVRVMSINTSTSPTSFPNYIGYNGMLTMTANKTYIRRFTRVRFEDLGTSGENYAYKFGFGATSGSDTTMNEDGAYIHYNYAENSGGFTLKTHDGSTLTTTNLGSAIAADTWYTLELIYYPHGECVAFVDGTRYSTTTTVPNSGNMTSTTQVLKKSGSTSRVVYMSIFEDRWVYGNE